MIWWEAEGLDYVLGLAKNDRLKAKIQKQLQKAERKYRKTGRAARFSGHQVQYSSKDVYYQTRESWSRARRVVAKAEHLEKGENPRFVVTSLSRRRQAPRDLYEELYCARGGRKQTRLQRCTRSAHFPFFKTIDDFDFALPSTLWQSLIGFYLGLDFVTEGRSLILHGKTGRGKTHPAVAIGYRAIQNGFETLFTTAAELIEISPMPARGDSF
jgi:DNA replication protein DnaC